MPLLMKNRWATLTCCSETPENSATERKTGFLQGFTNWEGKFHIMWQTEETVIWEWWNEGQNYKPSTCTKSESINTYSDDVNNFQGKLPVVLTLASPSRMHFGK